MTNCYQGIDAIQTITDECGGVITSTNCIQSPYPITTLSLPEGSTQAEINAALTTALVYKGQQIQELQAEIDELVVNSVTIQEDEEPASALNEGKLRYYTSGNNSYLDICMLTGVGTYSWVNILQNNF